MKTKPVGVRVDAGPLEEIEYYDPDFNLSEFTRCALRKKLVQLKRDNQKKNVQFEEQKEASSLKDYDDARCEIDAFLLGLKAGQRIANRGREEDEKSREN